MEESKVIQEARRNYQRWADIYYAMFVDSEFYETLGVYTPTREYLSIAIKTLPPEWRIVRDGVWYHCIPVLWESRIQGWKIHVSATAQNADEILTSVINVCIRENTPFKFVLDKRAQVLMNSKSWNRGGSGKFITVYPNTDQDFLKLLDVLYEQLCHFDGPYILSDKRYRDCKVLYYRYGGISQFLSLQSTGEVAPALISPTGFTVPDVRTPYFYLPAWAQDPFPDPPEAEEEVLNGRYVIEAALGFSNSGGVYQALDRKSGQRVVLKEARPFTCNDLAGNDAVKLLQKEFRILNRIESDKIAASPIELFWEWEHLFLVQELVPGKPIPNYSAMQSVLMQIEPPAESVKAWLREAVGIFIKLTKALKALHHRGIIFGDLSPNNVVVLPDLSVKLIDFEGAHDPEVDQPVSIYTPGFAPPDRNSRNSITVEDDLYALGALMLYILFPINTLMYLKPMSASDFLRSIESDFGLPQKLTNIILQLMDRDPAKRPSLESVLHSLKDEEVTQLMHRENLTSSTISSRLVAYETALVGIPKYILSVADTSRVDRLFPSDPRRTNPLSLDYGALGVVYSLHRLIGKVPDDLMHWILSREVSSERYAPGFYVGLSGIASALARLGYLERAVNIYDKAYNHKLLYNSSDLYSGSSGIGLAALELWLATGDRQFLQRAETIGEITLRMRRENEHGYFWPSADGDIQIGYAYGSSGIATFLLYLHLAVGNDDYLSAGMKALEFDLSYAVKIQEDYLSFPIRVGDTSRTVMPYWLYGSAGVGRALLRYFSVTKREEYRAVLERLLPDINRKYAIYPGLFRGLAGMGDFLLDCHTFLGDVRWLTAAERVASAIMLFAIERPTGIAFPGENLLRISTDFATGSAGIGLFLDRLVKQGSEFNFHPDRLLLPER